MRLESMVHDGMTRHARQRRDARRITDAGIEAALTWGRTWHHDGYIFHRIDRRTVTRARRQGADLGAFEGVLVVEGPDGAIVTVFRNREGRRVRR